MEMRTEGKDLVIIHIIVVVLQTPIFCIIRRMKREAIALLANARKENR
jgi:hypothetical protein